MTRRPVDLDEALLSDAPAAAVAAEAGVSEQRIRQRRAKLGIVGRTGRRPSATSRAALAALGAELVEIAEAASMTPADALVTLRQALNTREQLAALGDDP